MADHYVSTVQFGKFEISGAEDDGGANFIDKSEGTGRYAFFDFTPARQIEAQLEKQIGHYMEWSLSDDIATIAPVVSRSVLSKVKPNRYRFTTVIEG